MGSAKRSSSMNQVLNVDPQLKRPANADESVPEALVPDVVHTNLRRDDGEATDGQGAPDRWQRIRLRAYEIAQERGFEPGAELSDWLQAEREIDGATARQPRPEDQFTG